MLWDLGMPLPPFQLPALACHSVKDGRETYFLDGMWGAPQGEASFIQPNAKRPGSTGPVDRIALQFPGQTGFAELGEGCSGTV